MKKLEEFIEDVANSVSTFKDNFYKDVISLHYNEKLRNLARLGGGFDVTNTTSDPYLCYDKTGFIIYKREFNDEGSFCYYSRHRFKVKGKKLYAKYYSGNEEMLDIFPNLVIEQVANALEKGIRKIDFYQKAIAQKAKDEEAKKALDKMLEVGK